MADSPVQFRILARDSAGPVFDKIRRSMNRKVWWTRLWLLAYAGAFIAGGFIVGYSVGGGFDLR